MTRIEPLPREQWGDAERAAVDMGFPGAAARLLEADSLPNALAVMVHHPGLVGPFLNYNRVLLQEPVLDPRLRELLVLRVAWRTQSPYEWAQHVRIAAPLGIDADAVTRADGWEPLEAALLAATDQLIAEHRVDDDTWARLAEHLDTRQLLEVLFVVGTYTCLAMVFNSADVALDPDLTKTMPAPEE